MTWVISADDSCGSPNFKLLLDGAWVGFGTGVELLQKNGVQYMRNMAQGSPSWFKFDEVTQSWQWNQNTGVAP